MKRKLYFFIVIVSNRSEKCVCFTTIYTINLITYSMDNVFYNGYIQLS